MIDDGERSADVNEGSLSELPPPAFLDEATVANAKPVQPLPTSRVSRGIQGARDLHQTLTSRTRAVSLVLVVGLAMGALGGKLLVKDPTPDSVAEVEQSSTEISAPQDATKIVEAYDVSGVAPAGATASQKTVRTPLRTRRQARARVPQGQRAYRVAVIK